MSMDIELKPCPFCGGEAFLYKGSRTFYKGKQERTTYVGCLECHARGERFLSSQFGTTRYSKEANLAAAEAWNRRDSRGK